MTRPEPAESYFSATTSPPPPFAPLAGAVDCDVCVVGGGIAGCSAALHLAERGLRVVLLEGTRIGWGASGRSGGQVLPGYACGQDKLTQLVGRDEARTLWDMSTEAMALLRKLIHRNGIACDWTAGHLQAAIKPRHVTELQAYRTELERDYGYAGLDYLEGPRLRELLSSERYLGGLYDPNAGHLHPLKYTLGLGTAAVRGGVRIFEGTRVVGFSEGPTVRVRAEHGEVRCRHLVLCGNAYLNGVAPSLARKIMSVGTYIIATEPLEAGAAQRLIANNMAVSDSNWVLDYFRLSADRRLLFGGRVTYGSLRVSDSAPALRKRMLGVFPQLQDVRVAYSWGGHIDITMNRAPHFGRLSPNVYFLQGFSGHGIALTGLAGKLVAEAVAGTAERFDVFARIPHRDFPGGPLRRPALALAMLYYRLRDLL